LHASYPIFIFVFERAILYLFIGLLLRHLFLTNKPKQSFIVVQKLKKTCRK